MPFVYLFPNAWNSLLVSSEVWWDACASGWLITWPGDPNKSDSSKFWSDTSQIPSPPQYQGSLNLLTRLPLFASLAPAFTVGYFNIRDERHNPFLTFVSFIWAPYNGFKVSCLSIHRAKANFRTMQWEREESIYVCMRHHIISDIPADIVHMWRDLQSSIFSVRKHFSAGNSYFSGDDTSLAFMSFMYDDIVNLLGSICLCYQLKSIVTEQCYHFMWSGGSGHFFQLRFWSLPTRPTVQLDSYCVSAVCCWAAIVQSVFRVYFAENNCLPAAAA